MYFTKSDAFSGSSKWMSIVMNHTVSGSYTRQWAVDFLLLWKWMLPFLAI